MELKVLMLADRAWVAENGLLYVEGGGWEFIPVAELPTTVTGYVAGIIEYSAEDLGNTHVIQITAKAGQVEASSGSRVKKAVRRLAPFAIPFMTGALSEDTLVVEVVALGTPNTFLGSIDAPIRLAPQEPQNSDS